VGEDADADKGEGEGVGKDSAADTDTVIEHNPIGIGIELRTGHRSGQVDSRVEDVVNVNPGVFE